MGWQQNMIQPVLVTGATGFIGRRVMAKLLSEGICVKAIVQPETAIPKEWGEKVEIIRGSIADAAVAGKAVRDTGTVLHLAALVSDWGDEARFRECTVEGSRYIFEEALQYGARVLLVSSVVVYGDAIPKMVCSEETPFGKTFGPYSRTKQAQEKLAWEYYEKKGLRLSVVRPANVYGPASGTWLHDVAPVLKKGLPCLISGGGQNAGLAYVDNVADLILLAASSDAALGRAYNACDVLDISWKTYFSDLAAMLQAPEPRSLPWLVAKTGAGVFETLWRLLGIRHRPPITHEALNLVGSDNRFPMDRAAKELGYKPRISYAEGISRVGEYIRLQKYTVHGHF
ncbi:nucleoside-diphosphate-sugar epimerase [Desulfobotulus alkaliphilus]|uniref:Nucleoside-diphosphate-sugar epimerase n=1 Tax=Desulfobotulus alkaliphilus TaxID=622671 RepID=A0A562RD16_9BACT|nr:NAD-dependent epimerase/dehydratase family protein [Desulfobotulus alkaliphilus]TWI66947.1 nucleoside-diphosphate-sugar epimerase [Desulfobotulus alkaliphilus]